MKKQKEFSKILLIQESILIWIITINFIALAYMTIFYGTCTDFSWIAVLCSSTWGAYAISQAFYYKKSLAENTKNGIKYDSVMRSLDETLGIYEEDNCVEIEEGEG